MIRTAFLVSGWAFDESAWDAVSSDLDRRGWRVRAFRATARETLMAALDDSAEPVLLVGWSLGGQTAAEEALRRPDRTGALLFISSTPRFCTAPDFDTGTEPRRLRALSLALRARPAQALRMFFHDVAHPRPVSDSELERRVAAATALSPAELTDGLKALEKNDLRNDLVGLRRPVFCWHGDADRVIPCAASRRMADAIPGSRLHIEPGAGHDGFLHDALRACDWIETCASEAAAP